MVITELAKPYALKYGLGLKVYPSNKQHPYSHAKSFPPVAKIEQVKERLLSSDYKNALGFWMAQRTF